MFSPHGRLTKGYGAAVIFHLLLNEPILTQADIPTFTAKADTYFDATGHLPEVEANDVSQTDGQAI